jgi:hypothetical protein
MWPAHSGRWTSLLALRFRRTRETNAHGEERMADPPRRDRVQTDPFPLRRVARHRPLTDEELRQIYGHGTDDRARVSAPGVVRPVEWGTTDGRAARVPEPERWVPPAPAMADDIDDDFRIPIRRSRWGWPIVGAALVAAGGLLIYAVIDRTDLPESWGLTAPRVVVIGAPPVERAAIELEPAAVKIEAASAEPSAVATDPSETVTAAVPPRPVRARPPREPTPRAEQVPAATPYPDLERTRALEEVEEQIDRQLGISPSTAEPEPERAEPNDLKGLPEFEDSTPDERAPSRDNPYAEPEEPEEQPELPPPPTGIVRDPGF